MRALSLIFTILICSCNQNTFEDKEHLITYLQNPDNGYFISKSIKQVKASLMYRPTDLLVSSTIKGQDSHSTIDSLRNIYGKYIYMNLNFSNQENELLVTSPKSKTEFGDLVNQLAFGMEDKIHLYTSNRDTIPMVDYIYPRTYGMSKSTSLMVVFEKKIPKNNDFLYLSVEEFGLNIGEIKFKISTKKVLNEPKLSFIK